MQKVRISQIGSILNEHALPKARTLKAMIAKLKNISNVQFLFDEEIEFNHHEIEILKRWINESFTQKPLSKILEEKEFWSLNFITNTDTLDPRPDSEIIIEKVLQHISYEAQNHKILDLGTGTGCLLISLLHEIKNAEGTGVDISHKALGIAKKNATQNHVADRCQWIQSDWLVNVQGQYDVIVSNPPYIQNNYPLENSVSLYDPSIALFGGEDGLDAYRKILKDLEKFCTKKTLCFLEIGFDQKDSVNQLVKNHGFFIIENHQDLGGNDRLVIFGLN